MTFTPPPKKYAAAVQAVGGVAATVGIAFGGVLLTVGRGLHSSTSQLNLSRV
jgi:hypothetical protein